MGRRTIVALIATLSVALAVPVASPAPPSAPRLVSSAVPVATVGERAGFAPGGEILWLSDADLARELDAMAATGAKWLRLDFDWQSIQDGGRDSWNWRYTDRVVDGAVARGLRVVATPAYTPRWARPAGTTDKWGPNPDDYARFVDAAVRRYRSKVRIWEIWNEQNVDQFWQPKPDAAAYAVLLQRAAAAIRAVDPAATVVTGGTAPAADAADGSSINAVTFLTRLYDAGVGGSFDAVGHHPYSFPVNPLYPHQMNAYGGTLPQLRELMVARGDTAKQIWGTEFGVPTGTNARAVSEATQPAHVVEGYDTAGRWPWVGPIFYYALRDNGSDRSVIYQNFGLVRRDFSRKPAWDAFVATMAKPDGGTRPARPVAPIDRVATAVGVSQQSFPPLAARGVVLARSDDYADALAGVPLAAAANSPLLLTSPSTLDARALTEILRVLHPGGRVYLLGGARALSPWVEHAVAAAGFIPVRYAGDNRAATATDVCERALGGRNRILQTTGDDFPDAVVAGPAAAKVGGCVLLTQGRIAAPETVAYLQRHRITASWAIGGPAAAAHPEATAIVGSDRYGTAAQVASTFFTAPPAVGVASGVTFPDALSGGAQMAQRSGPLVLVTPTDVPAPVAAYLAATNSPTHVYGGPAALGDAVRARLELL